MTHTAHTPCCQLNHQYTFELLGFYNPTRLCLHSANKTLWSKSSRSWGDHAFSVAAHCICNRLPHFLSAVALQSSHSNPYSRIISLGSLIYWINFVFCYIIFYCCICYVLQLIAFCFHLVLLEYFVLLCMRHERFVHFYELCGNSLKPLILNWLFINRHLK